MTNYSNESIPALYKHIYATTYSFCENYIGSSHNLFNKLWGYFQNLIKTSLFTDLLSASNFGAYQLNINEYLLLQLTHALQINNIDFTPKISGDISAISSEILNGHRVVIASLHNGFLDGMKILSSSLPSNTIYCTIGVEPYISMASTKSKFSGNLHKISLDKYCLVNAKKALDNREVFFLAVDFSNEEENLFQFLDPSIFKFSALNQASLFFLKSIVKNDGSIEVSFQQQQTNLTSEQSCKDFLTFMHENNNFKRKLEIKKSSYNYSEHSD